MVKTAWDSVPQATISKCFNHVKIFPTTNDTNATTTNDEDDLPLNELQKLVRQLTDSEMIADDYVKIDNMEETGQTLDDKDILKLVAVDIPDVLVNSDDEDGTSDDGISDTVRNDVTLGQARSSLETLISYFEQTSVTLTEDDDNDINMKALDNLWKISRIMEDG